MKKILVPCDFSETAAQAFRFAVDVAHATSGEVIVLHVVDMPLIYESTSGIQPYMLDMSLIDDLKLAANKHFEVLVKEYGKGLEAIRFTIDVGTVVLSIRQAVDQHKPDLVVMGTNGASGFKEYFVGSNTEKVVRFSTVPVVCVRKSIPLEAIKNIVFATSLEKEPELVAKVKELQSFFSAMLHVLVVNTPTHFKRDKEIQDAMAEYALYFKLNNYTLNFRSDLTPMDGIIHFARETKAELIAMGTHGHRGVFHVLLGSTAEDVANHASCLVWTFAMKDGH